MPDDNDKEVCDSCRAAATRTFSELWLKGEDEDAALQAALRVIELRHPHRPHKVGKVDLLRWLLDE